MYCVYNVHNVCNVHNRYTVSIYVYFSNVGESCTDDTRNTYRFCIKIDKVVCVTKLCTFTFFSLGLNFAQLTISVMLLQSVYEHLLPIDPNFNFSACCRFKNILPFLLFAAEFDFLHAIFWSTPVFPRKIKIVFDVDWLQFASGDA